MESRIDLPITTEDQPYVSEFYARFDPNPMTKHTEIVIINDNMNGIDRIDINTQSQVDVLVAFLLEHKHKLQP